MDGIPQIVPFGMAEFMAKLLQSHQSRKTFLQGLGWQTGKPLQQRNRTVFLLIENHFETWHMFPFLAPCS
jgi:hypothetical protein